MVALLDLGIPLSVMARVALQRPQCEVAVCFSLSPWGFRRVTFDKLVWDPVGSSSRSPLIMRLLLRQATAPSPSWPHRAAEPGEVPGTLWPREGDPLPRCAREIHCEGPSHIPFARDRESFAATFSGAVIDHNLCSRAAGESQGMGGPTVS